MFSRIFIMTKTAISYSTVEFLLCRIPFPLFHLPFITLCMSFSANWLLMSLECIQVVLPQYFSSNVVLHVYFRTMECLYLRKVCSRNQHHWEIYTGIIINLFVACHDSLALASYAYTTEREKKVNARLNLFCNYLHKTTAGNPRF